MKRFPMIVTLAAAMALGMLLAPRIQAAASVVSAVLFVGSVAHPVPVGTGSSTTTDPHYGSILVANAGGVFTLESALTKAASFTGTAKTGLGVFNTLIVTWDVISAERDSANETYDLYIESGDGVSTWDIVHFPQVATTGAKRFTAFVYGLSGNYPQEVTTASPGVAAVSSGTFKTDTAGSNEGVKTLAAGKVRHGVVGDRLTYDLVVAGTVVTGINYSITATVK